MSDESTVHESFEYPKDSTPVPLDFDAMEAGYGILRDLAKLSSADVSEWDGWQEAKWCMFCGSEEKYRKPPDDVEQHEPDCLWRRAVELMRRTNDG